MLGCGEWHGWYHSRWETSTSPFTGHTKIAVSRKNSCLSSRCRGLLATHPGCPTWGWLCSQEAQGQEAHCIVRGRRRWQRKPTTQAVTQGDRVLYGCREAHPNAQWLLWGKPPVQLTRCDICALVTGGRHPQELFLVKGGTLSIYHTSARNCPHITTSRPAQVSFQDTHPHLLRSSCVLQHRKRLCVHPPPPSREVTSPSWSTQRLVEPNACLVSVRRWRLTGKYVKSHLYFTSTYSKLRRS